MYIGISDAAPVTTGSLIGDRTPGPSNAVTDVAGVRVGHRTLIKGSGPLVVEHI